MPGINQLPAVGRIGGMILNKKETPQESRCVLQYTGQNGQLYELGMPLGSALYLSNILKQMQDNDPDIALLNNPR
jgi:hypothetical protein